MIVTRQSFKPGTSRLQGRKLAVWTSWLRPNSARERWTYLNF